MKIDQTLFDEKNYLQANPDVEKAVQNGQFISGLDHFQRYGKSEGRVWKTLKNIKKSLLQTSRDEKILSNVDKKGLGLEIGPSHRPIAPKIKGFNVKILDHLTAEGLKDKYRNHGVDIDAIEKVDYVWSGEPLSELIGDQKFDWIIASHVVEHTPDFIGFLNECEKILADDGVLSLAVPDKRYCFDFFRETTSLASIIDAHMLGRTLHSPGKAADYFLNVTKKGGLIAWKDGHQGHYELIHNLQDALSGMKNASMGEYIDLHAWCFVPSSFRLLIEDLFQLELTNFRELNFFDTTDHEFFITLGKKGAGSGLSRMELMVKKQGEVMVTSLNDEG